MRRAPRAELCALAAVAVLLLWSRLANLGTSFWHDEAYTVVEYINQGPRDILFNDYHPNNHVLFSLLSWGTTGLVGHFEAAYRLWSVVPGVVAVPVLGLWVWRRFSPVAGAAVVVLLTMSVVHLDLTPQARGYGLVFLAEAGMLISAVRATDRGRVADLALFAFCGVAGTATYPVFGLAFASQAIALLVRRELRRPIVVGSAFGAVAAFLLYVPISDAVTTTSLTADQTQYGWLDAPFSDLARPSLATLLPDWLANTPSLVAIFGLLVVLGGRWLWRRGDRAALLQLTVPVVVSCLALMAFRIQVLPRFGSFLLLHVIVILAVGVVAVWQTARRVRPLRVLLPLTAIASLVIGSGDIIRITRDEATTPFENFKFVGQVIRGTGIRSVVTNSVTPQGLWYYTSRYFVRVVSDRGELAAVLCYSPAPLVFVDHQAFNSPEPKLACLRNRGFTRVHVEQRERGSFDIWVLIERARPIGAV